MCVDRAGIVGNDGETHQGLLDLAFFSIVPNLTILAPKDFIELEQMLEFATNFNKPVVIRYPRGGESNIKFETHEVIKLGKAEKLKTGKDITIVAIGKMVARAIDVSNLLETSGITCDVINARFLKPFDKKMILESIEKTNNVITIEDGILRSGLATSVMEVIIENGFENVNIKNYGYNDTFVKQGSVDEIEHLYGLDAISIANNIKTQMVNK